MKKFRYQVEYAFFIVMMIVSLPALVVFTALQIFASICGYRLSVFFTFGNLRDEQSSIRTRMEL